ncbi:hypothetical protein [Stenotrophomonas maltophilia]|uniref:hypothetical protein n=1 Tax=Stenotrophomonas maltophilia TaxID=40324 RepID=UPI0013FDF97D|nr:hypothetical protein [Stenotrophomonas maltophilia]
MSTDKTLADVQPGGRVRLGDQASAQGCDELRMRTDGERAAYLEGVAEGRRAVLSAQPSPGGQEVLETVEELAELNRTCAALDPDYKGPTDAAVQAVITALAARQPVVVDLPESLHDHVEALREVAARQPVGEPVAYLDLGAGGYMDLGTDLSDEELAALPKGRHMLGIIGTYGVDGYKPAQAVDLGQFREVVSAMNTRLQSVIGDNMMPWSERDKASKEQAALYPLLALIDSQAVGK